MKFSNRVSAKAVLRSFANASTSIRSSGGLTEFGSTQGSESVCGLKELRYFSQRRLRLPRLLRCPVHRAAVMRHQHHEPDHLARHPLIQQVAHGEEVAQGSWTSSCPRPAAFRCASSNARNHPRGWAQADWAISFSWWGNCRSRPPPWMSKDSPPAVHAPWRSIRCASRDAPCPRGTVPARFVRPRTVSRGRSPSGLP